MSMKINSSRVKIHGVYLDFVKSFDSVPLRNLHKLNKYHNLLNWIYDFPKKKKTVLTDKHCLIELGFGN